jgi:hypothetical protein
MRFISKCVLRKSNFRVAQYHCYANCELSSRERLSELNRGADDDDDDGFNEVIFDVEMNSAHRQPALEPARKSKQVTELIDV